MKTLLAVYARNSGMYLNMTQHKQKLTLKQPVGNFVCFAYQLLTQLCKFECCLRQVFPQLPSSLIRDKEGEREREEGENWDNLCKN